MVGCKGLGDDLGRGGEYVCLLEIVVVFGERKLWDK